MHTVTTCHWLEKVGKTDKTGSIVLVRKSCAEIFEFFSLNPLRGAVYRTSRPHTHTL
jgi:hypothetical protein